MDSDNSRDQEKPETDDIIPRSGENSVSAQMPESTGSAYEDFFTLPDPPDPPTSPDPVPDVQPEPEKAQKNELPEAPEHAEQPVADKASAESSAVQPMAQKTIEETEAKSVSVPSKKTPGAVKKSPVVTPDERYIVSSSPHVFGPESVSKIMWTVSATLAPAGLAGIYIFGWRALMIIIMGIIGAVGAEFIWQKLRKQKITISDGSAFLTGLLLAYNLSPAVAWWVPLLGSAFAIIIVKQIFGGLGNNIFNPALAGRAFLLASFPTQMTTWAVPVFGKIFADVTTGPTPLDLLKRAPGNSQLVEILKHQFPSSEKLFHDLLWGLRGGCIGETCSILLILGGLYLIYKKYIDWQVPVVYILTTGLFMLVAGGGRGILEPAGNVLIFHMFSGGLILGAFFMATDYVTIPATLTGRMIFAVGCGILTGVIRMWGGYPEGVCYSILIMNAFTPLIDDKIRTRVYGTQKERVA